MKLTFCGGAGAVTGANYLLEIADAKMPGGVRKILIDCGLAQGSHFLEELNYQPFAYNPADISEVFVTHAHIDHTGRLAKLVRDGFHGTVYSTPPTRDFGELLLLDSQRILEQEADRMHKPHLYELNHIGDLMQLWKGVPYHQTIHLGDSTKVTFYSAGHILGSATVYIEAEGKSIIFSGDLGNQPAPLIGPSECPTKADYCIMESAYGDRNHEGLENRYQKLERVILETVKDGGVLMIPAFALERTQILLLEMHEMLEKHQIPQISIFIDSPLAIKLTTVYNRYRDYLKPDLAKHFTDMDQLFRFPGLRMTATVEDSKQINHAPNPKIIVAGSGMSHAGRILHHEMRYLPDPKSTLLIFGYQAEGSMGRRLLEGAKSVHIMGEEVRVRAHVKAIGAYSAHADQRQLMEWVKPLTGHVKKVFLVQGEGKAATVLANKITTELGISAEVPAPGYSVML
jgi:metallo-beta-lactamase family protein